MINRVIVSGRLGADPRITDFDGGGKAASFSIAITERGYTKQDGTVVAEKTDWFRIETGNRGIAGIIEKYVKKGSYILIDGKLKNREWEKDGVKQYSTVIQIENMDLGPKNGEHNGIPTPEPEPKTTNKGGTKSTTPPPPDTNDDDLPF